MAKKKKVRVAFKKNRQKRTRANDLTRRYDESDSAPAEQSAERASFPRRRGTFRGTVRSSPRFPNRPRPTGRSRATSAQAQRTFPPPFPGPVSVRVHGGSLRSSKRPMAERFLATSGASSRRWRLMAVMRSLSATRFWFRPGRTNWRGRDHREGRLASRNDHSGLSPSGARDRGARRPGPDRLVVRGAGAEASADRPVSHLGREGGCPSRHRFEQSGPGRARPVPVGGWALFSTRVRDDRHFGGHRARDRAAPRVARGGNDGDLRTERCGKELAPERDSAPDFNLRVREVSDWTAKE